MVRQGASGEMMGAHACLPHSLAPSAVPGVLGRPTHVHRLDAPTGGLLVVAKTSAALRELSIAFAERCVATAWMLRSLVSKMQPLLIA